MPPVGAPAMRLLISIAGDAVNPFVTIFQLFPHEFAQLPFHGSENVSGVVPLDATRLELLSVTAADIRLVITVMRAPRGTRSRYRQPRRLAHH